MQLPDSLNICHLARHTHSLWPGVLCLCLEVVWVQTLLSNIPNVLALALYNSATRITVGISRSGAWTDLIGCRIKVNIRWGHFKRSQQASSSWSRSCASARRRFKRNDLIQCSAADCRYVCNLLYWRQKPHCSLGLLRQWWDELVAKIEPLHVCNPQTHCWGISLEGAATVPAVFLSGVFESGARTHTLSPDVI